MECPFQIRRCTQTTPLFCIGVTHKSAGTWFTTYTYRSQTDYKQTYLIRIMNVFLQRPCDVEKNNFMDHLILRNVYYQQKLKVN